MDRDGTRDRLLEATLAHVPFDGWTRAALRAGAADAGMDEADVDRFFPGGVREMVALFSDWADRRMAAAYEAADTGALRTRDRIALAVRLRFEALAPHREASRRTIAWLALPGNATLAARLLYRSVDAIWYAIGDRSADFSFYTKRALLAGVLASTALYWLEDTSEASAETWAFLDRRIENVMRIPALGARARRIADALPDPFGILRAVRGRKPFSSSSA